jgi:Zn-dependent protease
MRWSLRLGSVSGISIRVHVTFLLLVALVASQLGAMHGARGAVFGAATVIALFACVVLHELGHSLVAQRFGLTVREIVLLPIGGVARLLSEPRRPLHELLIALAGPAVNVIIAVVLLAVLQISPAQLFDVEQLNREALLSPPSPRALLLMLLHGNLILALFNMLPALPMDGGRVLRALLSMALGQVRATNIAAGLAQLLAVALAIYGFEHAPLLMLVAVLVFVSAGHERTTARTNVLLADLRAGEVCDPHATTFAPGDAVGHAIDQALRSPQAHFIVAHGREPLGTLSRDDVIALAGRVGLAAPLSSITRRPPQFVPAEMPLSDVRQKLQENGGLPVIVQSNDGTLGVLGLEDIGRIASLTDLLARGGVRRPVPVQS